RRARHVPRGPDDHHGRLHVVPLRQPGAELQGGDEGHAVEAAGGTVRGARVQLREVGGARGRGQCAAPRDQDGGQRVRRRLGRDGGPWR
ncbi:hypothetical protein BN1708_019987, partial [Verticillium longisporum]